MGIDRLFLGAFNTKIYGEEIIDRNEEKVFRAFDEILQEENEKLQTLVNGMKKKWTLESLSRKYNLKSKYHTPSNE